MKRRSAVRRVEAEAEGLGVLLAAMEPLRDRADVRLLVAGNHRGSPFVAEVRRRRLQDRVILCGFRRDLPVLMAGADVFVQPALYDAFPGVLLEAQASGTPVVTSSAVYCGAAELVEDGESGVLIQDPTDSTELARALATLLDEPERRRHIGEPGRRRVGTLTWERMCSQYELLYRGVGSVEMRSLL